MVVKITLHIHGIPCNEHKRWNVKTSSRRVWLATFSYMINYFIMGIILFHYKVFIKVLNRKHHKVFLTIISAPVAFMIILHFFIERKFRAGVSNYKLQFSKVILRNFYVLHPWNNLFCWSLCSRKYVLKLNEWVNSSKEMLLF